MGIMSSVIQQLAQQGKFSHEVTIGDTKFMLGVLSHDETVLADALIDMEELYKDLAGEENDLKYYSSAIDHVRTVTRLSLIIRLVNGIEPILVDAKTEERIKSIKDFRDDLMKLDPSITDRLNIEYNKLVEERQKFFSDSMEHIKK